MQLIPLLCLAALVACRSSEHNAVEDAFLGNPACPMSGNAVDPDSYFEHEGQRVYFCNPKCAQDGSLQPERYVAMAYPAAAPVGNATCPVSGHEVDGTTVTWQGREVGVCCPRCVDEFAKDPAGHARQALAE